MRAFGTMLIRLPGGAMTRKFHFRRHCLVKAAPRKAGPRKASLSVLAVVGWLVGCPSLFSSPFHGKTNFALQFQHPFLNVHISRYGYHWFATWTPFFLFRVPGCGLWGGAALGGG